MIHGLKTLSDVDVQGKRVLMRVDINSEVHKGKVQESSRFQAILPTLKELKKKKARVVLLAHQGRLGNSDFTSLKQHAAILNKHIDVSFIPDVIGPRAINAIVRLKPGEIVLLDNVRSLKEESLPSLNNALVKKLVPLFDLYINEAFSVSHRKQTSIVSFPAMLPGAIGRAFEAELQSLSKLNVKTGLMVMGGVKPEDYIDFLEKTRGPILATGYFGFLVLIAQGHYLGKENERIEEHLHLIPRVRKLLPRIVIPVDVAIEQTNGTRKDITRDALPSPCLIQDLGKKTTRIYAQHIKKAKTILFKGLPGLCHTPAFSEGTKQLLQAVASSKAFSVLSGGHTEHAVSRFKINRNKVGYISLSGGALIQYLTHKTLPGIEALKSSKHLQ